LNAALRSRIDVPDNANAAEQMAQPTRFCEAVATVFLLALQKTESGAAIGRHLVHDPPVRDQQQSAEVLAKFACLSMP
jgi:hypothetical protein